MSYRVAVDGVRIYRPDVAAYERRMALVSAALQEEQNKIAKFDFEMLPSQNGYNRPHMLKSTVTVYDDDELLFRGRPIKEKTNFYNTKTITCEGELGFLADIPDTFTTAATEDNPVAVNTLFAALLSGYAAAADDERKIYAGDCDITALHTKAGSGSCWDTLNGWIGEHGGYISLRRSSGNTYLDYKTTSGPTDTTQEIRFGVNLLEQFERMVDATKIETGVLAIGGTPDGASAPIDLSEYSGAENGVLYAATRENYGSIYKRVVFENALTVADLVTAAENYLAGVMSAAMQLKFCALENKLLGLAPNHMKIGTYYPIVSEPHGLNAEYPLVKRTLILMAPESSTTEMGEYRQSLTVRMANAEKRMAAALEKANTESKTPLTFDAVISQGTMTCTIRVKTFTDAIDAGKTLRIRSGGDTYTATGSYNESSGSYTCEITISTTAEIYRRSGLNAGDVLALDIVT